MQYICTGKPGAPATAELLHPIGVPCPSGNEKRQSIKEAPLSYHIETENGKPLLQASLTQQPFKRRRKRLAREKAPQPHRSYRAESEHDQLSICGQDPIGLAQNLVRIRGPFERMGQQHRIDALTGNGEMLRLRAKMSRIGPNVEQSTALGAGRAQKGVGWPPASDLQQLRAKNVLQHVADDLDLQIHQSLPE